MTQPAVWAPPLGPAAPRGLCTDCGLSRMASAKDCGRACQFIRPDYAALARAYGGYGEVVTRSAALYTAAFTSRSGSC